MMTSFAVPSTCRRIKCSRRDHTLSEATRPNPTDRGKAGTNRHLVVEPICRVLPIAPLTHYARVV